MIGSVIRRSEDDIDTVGLTKREIGNINGVCVCVGGGGIRGNKKKIKLLDIHPTVCQAETVLVAICLDDLFLLPGDPVFFAK